MKSGQPEEGRLAIYHRKKDESIRGGKLVNQRKTGGLPEEDKHYATGRKMGLLDFFIFFSFHFHFIKEGSPSTRVVLQGALHLKTLIYNYILKRIITI